MPEITIYESDDMNAFATGRSKNSSLIAISTALLKEMDRDGVEAVIAHEIAHIVNGDMVTQTLLQSLLNIIVSTILIPFTVTRWIYSFGNDSNSRGMVVFSLILETIISFVLFFIGGLLSKMYSRNREFGADYVAAQLTDPSQMISALKQLQTTPKLAPTQKKICGSPI